MVVEKQAKTIDDTALTRSAKKIILWSCSLHAVDFSSHFNNVSVMKASDELDVYRGIKATLYDCDRGSDVNIEGRVIGGDCTIISGWPLSCL